MRAHGWSLTALLTSLVACGSSSHSANQAVGGDDAGGSDGGTEVGAEQTVNEHGIVYDYGSILGTGNLVPVQGLTVTEGNQSTTTDAQGNWSLTRPAGATIAGVVSGTSKSDPYSTLMLVSAIATGPEFDHGNIIIPDVSTFSLERLTLSANSAQAVVHVVVHATDNCTSAAGGTLTVTAPAGAQVMYFDTSGYPSTSQTSFADLDDDRPVADIYNLTPGVPLTVQVNHPTCQQVPYPAAYGGGTLTGQVPTKAAEPGDNNTAMVIMLD